MGKKQNQQFETMEFDDNLNSAEIGDSFDSDYRKKRTGLILSIIATVCSILGWLSAEQGFLDGFFEILLPIGVILAVVSYILGGGIGEAIRWVFKVGAFGYHLVDMFPIDLVLGALGLIFGFISLFFIPVVFVYSNYR